MIFLVYFLLNIFLGLSYSYLVSNRIPSDLSTDHHYCWNGIKPEDFVVVCYFNDWSNYRPEKGQFGPKDISGAPCTHIIYAFAVLKEDTLDAFEAEDPSKAIEEGFYHQVTGQKNNGLKVMLGLGGWADSTPKYSKMLADPELRAKVVKQTTEFLIKWNFDGLDVAIDYPNAYQGELNSGMPEDKINFVQFLKELRYSFDAEVSTLNKEDRLLLSVTVSASERFIDVSYDIPSIVELSDWIGVLSYNFHGLWDNRTGIMAPFTVQPGDEGPSRRYNLESAMNMWLTNGAPADKLIAGFSGFGRSFVLANESDNIINSPTDGIPEQGEFTRYKTSGVMAFYEVIDSVHKKSWTSVHMNYLGSYAYKGNQWVGYDDVFDVAVKAFYVKINCFRGVSFWSLDLECFQANCPTGKYPLIKAANDVLKNEKPLWDFQNLT